MNKLLKWILIPLFIIIIIYYGFKLIMFFTFDGLFDSEQYTKQDLIENYDSNHSEISHLNQYFKSIIPVDKKVTIEFEKNKITRYHIRGEGIRDSNWDLEIDSKKVASLNQCLGWSLDTIERLKSKLAKAHCVSIESGNPTTIGFQRSGMGMYFYNLFDKKLNDSLISEYNDGCQYSFYKENIVLEFGGGAIGRNCFEDFFRK